MSFFSLLIISGLLTLLTSVPCCQSLSSSSSISSSSSSSPPPLNSIKSNSPCERRTHKFSTTTKATSTSRRQWFHDVLFVVSGGVIVTAAPDRNSNRANAACLPGDLSKDCIGVYKVPIDDNVLPYVSTPEALKKFAPDIKYVPPIQPPNNIKDAMSILTEQRSIVDDIQSKILKGQLEDAGLLVLNLLPKLTSSGRVIVTNISQELPSSSSSSNNNNNVINNIRVERLQDQLDLLTGLWGECDVMIGQGIRGEMGVSAAAQIQVLGALKDATVAFDDFLASATAAATK